MLVRCWQVPLVDHAAELKTHHHAPPCLLQQWRMCGQQKLSDLHGCINSGSCLIHGEWGVHETRRHMVNPLGVLLALDVLLITTRYMKPLFGGRPPGMRIHGDLTDSDDEATCLVQPGAPHTIYMAAPMASVSDVELLGGASEAYVPAKDTPPGVCCECVRGNTTGIPP